MSPHCRGLGGDEDRKPRRPSDFLLNKHGYTTPVSMSIQQRRPRKAAESSDAGFAPTHTIVDVLEHLRRPACRTVAPGKAECGGDDLDMEQAELTD